MRVLVVSRSAYAALERSYPIASRIVLENLKAHTEEAVQREFPGGCEFTARGPGGARACGNCEKRQGAHQGGVHAFSSGQDCTRQAHRSRPPLADQALRAPRTLPTCWPRAPAA